MRKLEPNTFIIGAQKAATTALIVAINKLPGAYAHYKELNYFGTKNSLITWDRYCSLIEMGCSLDIPPRVIVEKSPDYMAHPEAAWRMHKQVPQAKIIACLREPGERAYSRYRDIVADYPERYGERTFGRVLRAQLKRDGHLVRFGRYAEQLAPYIALFPRNQIHVVIQERLKVAPKQELGRLTDFLGLPPLSEPIKTVHSNKASEPMDAETRSLLSKYFAPHNEKLRQLLNDPLPEWDTHQEPVKATA